MSYSAPQTVVNLDSLDKFPFESQCLTALSQLLCHSKTPDKIHYIRFPFGLIDINGLKSIISVFESRAAEKRTLDEKKWLNCDIKNPHSNVLPSSDILSFFHSHIWAGKKSDQISCVQNLVGTHWLTDSTLKYIADINDTRNDALCFVLQHPSRRKGIPRGSQKAAQGCPIKRKRSDDENYELKRGKPEHTKRKRNLKLNETLNQPNYFKH